MILLQVVTDTTSLGTVDESLSVFDLAVQGGFMMIPIFILSVIAIYFFFERLMIINKANQNPDQFMNRVKELVVRGDINGARMLCAQQDSPVSRMIQKGLTRIGSPLKNIEASIENVGKLEIFKLEKNLSSIATIAGAAHLFLF